MFIAEQEAIHCRARNYLLRSKEKGEIILPDNYTDAYTYTDIDTDTSSSDLKCCWRVL
jgi:hypothetical protein